MNSGIVLVGYNRLLSIERLFGSVCQNNFFDDSVDLIFSIDCSDRTKDIIDFANKTSWQYGNKIVRSFKERQGLKSHILQCGALSEKYDFIVILEDDVVVSNSFYAYAREAVIKYGDDELIGGISLYSFKYNFGIMRPFFPKSNGSDTFLLKIAQSWGQCWTRKMWSSFYSWLLEKKDLFDWDNSSIPFYLKTFGSNSWLRLFDLFLIENNKFFVYPYNSFSTIYAEKGEHNSNTFSGFQVPIVFDKFRSYNMLPVNKMVKYDEYFEYIDESEDDICFDLYGTKRDYSNYKYLLSTKRLKYRVIKSFGLVLRPQETNYYESIEGKSIFLYELSKKNEKKPKSNTFSLIEYDVGCISWKRCLSFGIKAFVQSIKMRIKRKK